MLPIPLLGIYRQYKQDTDSVAFWLASTAKSCGYPADLLSDPILQSAGAKQAPKSGRLKCKARAKARAAGGAKTAPQPESTDKKSTKYIIAIKDFLPLANFIGQGRL
jgi:hypothetical protein